MAENAVASERAGVPVRPDENASRDERMALVAVVDEAACTPCGACQAVCPTEAITLAEVSVKVNADACCGCGACTEVCPSGAMTLR